MEIPTLFTISPSSQEGDVYGTEFTFNATLPSQYTTFAWNFGDSRYIEYNKRTTTHTYNYPGIYTIQLSAWTPYGETRTEFATVNVDYVYRDSINFDKTPVKFGVPGIPTIDPFVISITSAKIDCPLAIVLQSQDSNSVPHDAVPDKWRFITPKWKFLDENLNAIEGNSLVLNTVPIYKNSKIVAVKSVAKIYYVDDIATGTDPRTDCPLLISVTLSTTNFSYPPESLIYPYASYSNSEVSRAAINWQISDVIPTKLLVTENFIHDIYPIKWTNVPIPVMITCIYDTSVLPKYTNSVDISANILSYPRTNELGNLHPVTLSLSSSTRGTLTSSVDFSASNLYFRSTDEYNNVASGYLFTTIMPLTSTTIGESMVVVAKTVATNQLNTAHYFKFPDGYPIHREVYVSNPLKGTINRTGVISYFKECGHVNYYKKLGLVKEGSQTVISVPVLTSLDTSNYTLTGMSGVYALAFNPVLNRLYTGDADLNTISYYSEGLTLEKTFDLTTLIHRNRDAIAPSHISIDRNNNLWIAMFDSHVVVKFDEELNYIELAYPEDVSDEDLLSESTFISPPIVETDMNNDIWVCYSNDKNSMLIKFNSSGKELFKVSNNPIDGLPSTSVPVSLAIDATNGVWVACKHENAIRNYSSSGVLLTAIPFISPSYIVIDRFNNVWVTHEYDLCSVYNTTSSLVSTWKFDFVNEKVIKNIRNTSDLTQNPNQDELWGGLGTDVFDNMWIIDSVNNKYAKFDPQNPLSIQYFNVQPTVDVNRVLNINGSEITVPSRNSKSAQAGGDWTGNRWYQKYSGTYDAINISGTSAPFKVQDLDKADQISKINEDFNFAEHYKGLALPEQLKNNTNLFDNAFVGLVGDGDISKESVGRIVYEKIANFISAHGDIDTMDSDKLISIAESMAVDTKNFGEDFPVAVKRLVDLFSIPKQNLRGIPNIVDFTDRIGTRIFESDFITANTYYVAQDRTFNSYQLIYTSPLSGNILYYHLSDIQAEGLRTPILNNYYFYEYNDIKADGYTGNLIDWNSAQTTISYNLSSYEDWYGDGGLVETAFNNLLTKQLYLQ